eukprot:454541-Rhodomonas_salina.1
MLTLYDEFVVAPGSAAEVAKVEAVYRHMGFPGCVGSIDCVHVAWEGCPAVLHNQYKGGEGYPSIAYEVTVCGQHTRGHGCCATEGITGGDACSAQCSTHQMQMSSGSLDRLKQC